MDTTTSPPVVAKPSLGTTALDAWRAWRSLGWQGIPCYGNALGQGTRANMTIGRAVQLLSLIHI